MRRHHCSTAAMHDIILQRIVCRHSCAPSDLVLRCRIGRNMPKSLDNFGRWPETCVYRPEMRAMVNAPSWPTLPHRYALSCVIARMHWMRKFGGISKDCNVVKSFGLSGPQWNEAMRGLQQAHKMIGYCVDVFDTTIAVTCP